MAKAPQPNKENISPPSNIEAEQSVLGAILLRSKVLDTVIDMVAPEDFYREAHRKIYQAIIDLYNKQEPVDIVSLNNLLKERGQLREIGGPLFLTGLSEQVGIAANADYYARLVHDKAVLRRLLVCSQEIAAACMAPVESVGDFLDWSEAQLFQVTDQQTDSQIYSVGYLGRQNYAQMESLYNQQKEAHGLLTGLYDLDRLTIGLHGGEETVLAARPGMGKTALGLNVAWHIGHKLRQPVAIFSLEMQKEQLIKRLICGAARIDGESIRRCKLTPAEWAAMAGVQEDLDDAPIFIDDTPAISALHIRAKCRRIKARYGLAFVVIDYLQLMREPARSRSRDEAVSQNAYAIKSLAKELNIPVLVCCQVNRDIEKEKRKKYRLSDLRESGAVEQAADNIWFLWRDEEATVADLTIGKQRNGPVGSLQLTYSPPFTRFDNFASTANTHWQNGG